MIFYSSVGLLIALLFQRYHNPSLIIIYYFLQKAAEAAEAAAALKKASNGATPSIANGTNANGKHANGKLLANGGSKHEAAPMTNGHHQNGGLTTHANGHAKSHEPEIVFRGKTRTADTD
jgi:hypothetical protein